MVHNNQRVLARSLAVRPLNLLHSLPATYSMTSDVHDATSRFGDRSGLTTTNRRGRRLPVRDRQSAGQAGGESQSGAEHQTARTRSRTDVTVTARRDESSSPIGLFHQNGVRYTNHVKHALARRVSPTIHPMDHAEPSILSLPHSLDKPTARYE